MKRYNIYSCFSIKYDSVELCFDPAKIRREDLDEICPNAIFISHESMDHMDPIQVYVLQKKKNCKIYCSIAVAVDLIQFFPCDIDFKEHVNALIPGAEIKVDMFSIIAEKSIHCDYMMPIVFKIVDNKTGLSILHCFDSFLSDKIIELSKNTNVAIIPMGIAKGISISTGQEFMNKLYSEAFVTNHFKKEGDLEDFKCATQNSKNCFYLNWNEACSISVNIQKNAKQSITLNEKSLCSFNTIELISDFNRLKHKILSNDEFVKSLFEKYDNAPECEKIESLLLYSLIALSDASVIDASIVNQLKTSLSLSIKNENNCFHAVVLFFLGIYAQQSSRHYLIEDVFPFVNSCSEHVTYWIVEFLGRTITSSANNGIAVQKMLDIIAEPALYNSVVIRRRIFWELHRIMKYFPSLAVRFIFAFEGGLIDSNPDVRLLAVLCFSLTDKITELSEKQLDKILDLLEDDEEDVRETTAKVVRDFQNINYVAKNKSRVLKLLKDHDCHVRNEAKLTQEVFDRLAI
jgi:hypothetical protein